MATRDQIRHDAESALRDTEVLRREIMEFGELQTLESALSQLELPAADALSEFMARAAELIARISEALQALREQPGQFREPENAFALTTLAQELKAQLEWLESLLAYLEDMAAGPAAWPRGVAAQVSAAVGATRAKLTGYLIPLFKRFLSKLWSLISGLLTPKEWKLKGQLGTGLLGLASVEVEISFGP